MKSREILHHNLKFAALINNGLRFAEVMLSRTEIIYPFAAVSIGGDIQPVFAGQSKKDNSAKLIERLETRIMTIKLQAPRTISMLAYNVTVTSDEHEYSDAIALSLTDAENHSSMTIYPYNFDFSGIEFGRPYSCKFTE